MTGAAETSAASLPADYFDGTSARPRRVALGLRGPMLHIDGADGLALRVSRAAVRWPERTRHGARIAHLPGGGALQALDAQAWDAWARHGGIGESYVVRAQQNWRGTLTALLLLVLLAGAAYRWGVPWAARAVLAGVPASADRRVGDAALRSIDASLLRPSTVPAERQRALRDAFARALAQAGPELARTPYELRFNASPPRGGIGANAFALPGGTIVVTDEMLALLQGRDDVLIGVLGHELGHVRRRHGMRLLVQTTLIATASSLAWGDFSSVLASAPALLGQRSYSRDFEREADTDAITLLRANGLSPAVMAELFERLAAQRSNEKRDPEHRAAIDLGIALASHPDDAERIARFREAAAR